MKKLLLILFTILFCIYYIIHPQFISESCQIGVMLWFEQIFPILFIFTILTNILLESNILLNVSASKLTLLIFLIGCISGFPIGAKLTADFGSKNLIEKNDYALLCAISNHFSLPFIIVYTVVKQLNMPQITYKVLISLYAPSLLVLLVYLIMRRKSSIYSLQTVSIEKSDSQKRTAPGFELNTQIIDAGIINGFETLIKLCAYIVLFSIIARLPVLYHTHNSIVKIIFSYLEATNGIHNICNMKLADNVKTVICTSILSFGGISCILQTHAMFTNQKLNLFKYIILKLVLTLSSVLLITLLLTQ